MTAADHADTVAGLVLGTGWAVVVVSTVIGRSRRRSRRRPDASVTAPSGRDARWFRRSPLVALGAAIRRLAGRPRGGVTPARTDRRAVSRAVDHRRGRRPGSLSPGARSSGPIAGLDTDHEAASDTAADRRVGIAAVGSVTLATVAPMLAVVPVAWAVVAPVLAARRARAHADALLHDQLPDVVDLLSLTTAAGLPVNAALVAIADRPGGPIGAALARAAAHVRRGGSTADALARVAALGPPVRPLVDALVQHDRYGSALLPALERVGIEARARRRRRAEESARRLPVTLLLPLVLTTFPAFVLLTVVPLLAGSLGSLSPTST